MATNLSSDCWTISFRKRKALALTKLCGSFLEEATPTYSFYPTYRFPHAILMFAGIGSVRYAESVTRPNFVALPFQPEYA